MPYCLMGSGNSGRDIRRGQRLLGNFLHQNPAAFISLVGKYREGGRAPL